MQPLVSFQSRHLPDDGNGVLAYTIATHNQMGRYGLPGAGMCYAMSALSPQSLLLPAFQAPVAGLPETEGHKKAPFVEKGCFFDSCLFSRRFHHGWLGTSRSEVR